jgi:uncharacterized protein YacL
MNTSSQNFIISSTSKPDLKFLGFPVFSFWMPVIITLIIATIVVIFINKRNDENAAKPNYN